MADQLPDCDNKLKQCIDKCDNMRREKNEELKLGDIALQKCQEISAINEKEKTIAQEKLQSPLRNPFFMGLLGVVVGGVAAGFLLRK